MTENRPQNTENQTPFECKRCGACCRIPGYVRITDEEVRAIAAHLGMQTADFIELCTVSTTDRPGLSISENPSGACIFLRPDLSCDIADVKPVQCREFPLGWAVENVENFCAAMRR